MREAPHHPARDLKIVGDGAQRARISAAIRAQAAEFSGHHARNNPSSQGVDAAIKLQIATEQTLRRPRIPGRSFVGVWLA
jgi:hypothetical protein